MSFLTPTFARGDISILKLFESSAHSSAVLCFPVLCCGLSCGVLCFLPRSEVGTEDRPDKNFGEPEERSRPPSLFNVKD